MELRTKAESLIYIHLSNICFAATAILISALSSDFNGWFTAFARFAIGALLGFSQLGATKTPFRIIKLKPWLGRGLFGAIAMTLYYISIALGNPGRASLFNNSFPIFVAIISIVALREKVRISTVAGVFLAFTGVAFVLWDGTGMSFIGDAAGIASGFLAGISYHFNKRASQTEHPIVIYLGVCFVGLLTTAFAFPQAFSIDPRSALLLVLAGAGAYAAQIFITIGLRDIPTTEGSVHTFMKIPLTVVAGYLFLDNPITLRFVAGTALLLVGLFLNDRTPQLPMRKRP